MTIRPDARLEDADWPKRAFWDFADTPDDYWETAPIEVIQRIVTLPVFEAAPEDVAETIQRRLAEIED